MGKLERSISLFDLTGIMVRIGGIIPMAWPYFRLVKGYNFPR